MPRALIARINDLRQLRDETGEIVAGVLGQWDLKTILEDAGAIQALVAEVLAAVGVLLEKANAGGRESGGRILGVIGGKPHREVVDFQAILSNSLADQLEDINRSAEQFGETLRAEAQKMAGKGMDAGVIIDLLERDWDLGSKGRICGELWRALERRLCDQVVQVFSLAELAIRAGQELEIGI